MFSPPSGERGSEFTVALVMPFQGTAGIYGPSCHAAAQLAIEELNAGTGIAGCSVRAIEVDGGRNPEAVAAEIDRLTTQGAIDAVVGWHISAVRQAIVERLAGRLPYIYTAVYEGGERSHDVFVTAETPFDQLLPAMTWMRDELGARRWFIVGNDYVWPRVTAKAAVAYAHELGGEVVGNAYTPLGSEDYGEILDQVETSHADGVLMLLIGQDMVHFNRQFAARGLDSRFIRFSTILDENALLGMGSESTRRLYAAAGYFGSLATGHALDFLGRLTDRFGPYAPPSTNLGESCYEGVHLLGQLLDARHTRTEPLLSVASRLRYESPRGDLSLAANHLRQPVYMATACGVDFDITAQLRSA